MQKEHEAKTKNTLAPADKLNNTELQNEAREPDKEEKDPTSDMGGHENKGSITRPICDPNKRCEKPEEVIPKSKTKAEAVMPQLTSCDRTPELTVGASTQLSTRAARAALLWKTLQ